MKGEMMMGDKIEMRKDGKGNVIGGVVLVLMGIGMIGF